MIPLLLSLALPASAEAPKVTRIVTESLGDACVLTEAGEAVCAGKSAPTGGPPGPFAQIALGFGFACGLRPEGTLACWGRDDLGQTRAPEGRFTQVTAGTEHACAIREDGALACWGGERFDKTRAPKGTFRSVDANRETTCAVRTSGQLACWGALKKPYLDPPSGTVARGPYVQVAVGFGRACGILATGALACWGKSLSESFDVPPPEGGGFVAVDVGEHHACALRNVDELVCWGSTELAKRQGQRAIGVAVLGRGACQVTPEHHAICSESLHAALDALRAP